MLKYLLLFVLLVIAWCSPVCQVPAPAKAVTFAEVVTQRTISGTGDIVDNFININKMPN